MKVCNLARILFLAMTPVFPNATGMTTKFPLLINYDYVSDNKNFPIKHTLATVSLIRKQSTQGKVQCLNNKFLNDNQCEGNFWEMQNNLSFKKN